MALCSFHATRVLPVGPLRPCAQRPSSLVSLCASQESAALACVPLSESSRHYKEFDCDGLSTTELDMAGCPTDYFRLLNIELDASDALVRDAYRKLQRLVHPDIAGDEATELAAHINSAYSTLSNPKARESYVEMVKIFRSEMGAFDGRPVSSWGGASNDTHALFVDETLCIGCQQCTFCAPNTFQLEEAHGRARVATQWGDDREDIQDAMELCPVTCIHLVPRTQVALLEYVMKACKREDAAILARRRTGNMATSVGDNPFARAETYVRKTKSTAHTKVETRTAHDHILAASIAQAWKRLPPAILETGWPDLAARYRAS